MNKTLYTAILFFLGQSAIAQKGIDNMIKAEKDFAAYSVTNSTKEAFQKFIDSNSIMFDKGEPVKAIDFWNKREKRPGILNWHPQYSEISVSDDFGYTTGPWTFQNSITDSIVARGQYATIWYLDQKGNWKFLIDFGIDNTQPGSPDEYIVDPGTSYPDSSKAISHIYPLVSAEQNFNKAMKKNTAKAYAAFLSSQSILLRNGSLPAVNKTDQKPIIDSTPSKLAYEMKGWNVSSAHDMGYTYGKTIIKGEPQNYFRIWRREKEGWKIAVEVFRY